MEGGGGGQKGVIRNQPMARIPVRFQRVAAAFDEGARVRLCESSGSEHSPESSTDLSDLVKSFMERSDGREGDDDEIQQEILLEQKSGESDDYWSDSEAKEMLQGLFGDGDSEDRDEDDGVKRKIYAEAEAVYNLFGSRSSRDSKRRLMTHLRDKGFDAGK